MLSMENLHFVKGIDPVADAFSGTVASDIINLKNAGTCMFVIYKGVGATGTSTITVTACSDVSATAETAIKFQYRAITTGDTEGALTQATTAGFATTAGSSQLYVIEVKAQDIASTGYSYVRLNAVELVNSPVLGGILCFTGALRYNEDVNATAIV